MVKAKQSKVIGSKSPSWWQIELGFYQTVCFQSPRFSPKSQLPLSWMISKTLSHFTMDPLLLSYGEYFHLVPSETMLTGHFLNSTEELFFFFSFFCPLCWSERKLVQIWASGRAGTAAPRFTWCTTIWARQKRLGTLVTMQVKVKMVPDSSSSVAVRMR